MSLDDILSARQSGDDAMRQQDWNAASDHYFQAWQELQQVLESDDPEGDEVVASLLPEQALWLLLSCVDAHFQAEEFENAFEAGALAFELFGESGLVVGNPFFHLRMGQIKFELVDDEDRHDTEPGSPLDELSRALICGGIELFKGEDPKYLEATTEVLEPPAEHDSWHEARNWGCSCDLLNDSGGYLRELFTERYGAAPPYEAPEE